MVALNGVNRDVFAAVIVFNGVVAVQNLNQNAFIVIRVKGIFAVERDNFDRSNGFGRLFRFIFRAVDMNG